jgi:hypothetical protein
MPRFFWADSNYSDSTVDEGIVLFNWETDKRTKRFRLTDDNIRQNNGIEEIFLDVPSAGVIQTEFSNTPNTIRYSYYMPKTLAGTYRFTIQPCHVVCDPTPSNAYRMYL